MKLRAVDLFCGVGGFALGMQRAGMMIVRSIDFDQAVLEVHKANVKEAGLYKLRLLTPLPITPPEPVKDGKIRRGQIRSSHTPLHVVDLTAVLEVAPEIALLEPDVIFGGPPCQAFSRSGQRKGDDDKRSLLTEAYAIMVATARPKYFVMENVKGLGKSETYKRAVAVFRRAGYGLTETVVNASFFGTPQARERLILAGCLGETDGWFHPYLNQYKSAQKLSVADVFGAEFGTPLQEFALDPETEDVIDEHARAEYQGYKLKERDRQRLNADDVTPQKRFFHATPGGKGSATLHPIDKPAGTLIRTTMHALAKTYRPLSGDPVDLRKLYHPTFEEFAKIGGFPDDWKWPQIVSEKDGELTEDEFVARARQRLLMLANAVPPPLAYAIGRAIADHHERKVPVPPVEAKAVKDATWRFTRGMKGYRRYADWLRIGKGLDVKPLRQHLSDLRKAMSLVMSHRRDAASENLSVFDSLAAAKAPHMKPSRRSQLRKALKIRAEFEKYQAYTDGTDIHEDDEAYAIGGLAHVIASQRLREQEALEEAQQLYRADPTKTLRSLAARLGRSKDDRSEHPGAE